MQAQSTNHTTSAIQTMESHDKARKAIIAISLTLIILLGIFLRLYQLGAYDIGNAYYAATVKSMLSSWHNFFYASFEPGGSVTVDKPPLGFWVQAVSVTIFGLNGFALAFPNALAGALAIPLLYYLVSRQFNPAAGLIAALVLATTPVTVSTERNNTIDGLLVFVLLLAVWAVWRSVRGGKARYLFLGMLLVGLGFNIKMLQAYMVLPALYALYWLGARHAWWKRLAHLALATVLLLVVSLSWAVIVDLTPANERPYIGSSDNNTVMELIIGHNGLSRLGLNRLLANDGAAPPADDQPQAALQPNPPQLGVNPPAFGSPGANPPNQPPGGPPPNQAPVDRPRPGQPGGLPNFNQEVGEAGLLRLFTEPLSTEASWLLPLAMCGILLILVQLGWQWPLSDRHLALVLWAGWLLPAMIYFTFTTGIMHAYYLIMLGPPVAALVGASAWALWRTIRQRPWLGWLATGLLSGLTLAFQFYVLSAYPAYLVAAAVLSGLLWFAGMGLLLWQARQGAGAIALATVCLSLVVAPLLWSAATTLNNSPNVWLPESGPATGLDSGPAAGRRAVSSSSLTTRQRAILDYLLANSPADGYLMAANAARSAAQYILATGRAVFTFGGFSGGDQVIDLDGLIEMVSTGEIRFVLGDGLNQKPQIANWLQQNCSIVDLPGLAPDQNAGSRPGSSPRESSLLYDCANRSRAMAPSTP